MFFELAELPPNSITDGCAGGDRRAIRLDSALVHAIGDRHDDAPNPEPAIGNCGSDWT
jgi:hypothetical protein